jgi:uncharacterized membrane protein
MGLSLFILSFLPYLTIFVAENFYSFVAHAFYGLDFLLTAIISILIAHALKNSDKGNIALLLALESNLQLISALIVVSIGLIIGYFFYPPAVIISCLISILLVWIIPHLQKF